MKVVEEPILADGMNRSNSLPRKIETERNRKGGIEFAEGGDIFEKERRAFSGYIQRRGSKSEAVLGKKACQ